jgi:hypothetical protein
VKDNSHRSTYFLEAAETASSSIASSASTSSPSASLAEAASSSAAVSSAFSLPFNFAESVALVDLPAIRFLRTKQERFDNYLLVLVVADASSSSESSILRFFDFGSSGRQSINK